MGPNPSLKILKRLRPLEEFETEQLNALAKVIHLSSATKKEEILALGSTDDDCLFILEGDIKMTSSDGVIKIKTVSETELLNPIAQLRPSIYQIQAVKEVLYLKISKSILTQYSSYGHDDHAEVEVTENDPAIEEITMNILKDMMSDELSLPSLPEIALKIQSVYKDDLADLNSIANLIMMDPSISAKLIKIANSLVYQGEVPTETLKAAISRLGLDTTYKQVMAYAVNDLFKSSSACLKEKMEELWMHSRKVAAISHLLAKETKLFNPELAMLAGLVHDLGTIVILEYLEKTDFDAKAGLTSEKIVETLRPVITGMLMNKWNFTEDTKIAAEECEEWFRNPTDEADLCDVILVAQYHSYIGTDAMKGLPPITSIPAMKKLGLNPKESIALMKSSKDRIKAMEAMFN